ncbi:MAG: zinc-binding dehydrogenase [SAR202 cluster bacterium]|nr:zinc-binding dehydrogenase [SAR202 cluster bacterium]|tara:strand:+ start:72770 stop:73831 length:1062 start_codon:yes stop_codon:yes gene_type:complete
MIKTLSAILVEPKKPLEIEELIIPDPSPEQVVVEQIASGICLSQVHEIDKTPIDQCPRIIGHEGVGIATHVGSSVKSIKEGDNVITTWVPRSNFPGRDFVDSLVTGIKYKGKEATGKIGTFSQKCLVDQELVVPIPSEYYSEEASIVGCAVLTGAGSVLHTASVRPEDSVAVIGVGGVGLSAIKMASLLQAYPIVAVDISDDKLDFARKWGATHTINSTKTDPVEEILKISKGGVDYAFDAVGTKKTHEIILPMVKGGGPGAYNNGGTAILIGWPHDTMEMVPRDFLFFQRQYKGSHGASDPNKDFKMYLRLDSEGKFPLKELVTKKYDFMDINKGLSDLRDGNIFGRALVTF